MSIQKGQAVFERRFFAKGDYIIHKGQDGNCAYLIQSGAVRVFDTQDGQEINLARLGVGQIFGEMALVLDQKRSASVKAVKNTTVIIISRIAFEEKLDSCDSTVKSVTKMMMKRVGNTTEDLLAQQKKNVMLVEDAYAIFTKIKHAVDGEDVVNEIEASMEEIEVFLKKYIGS